MKILMIAPQPFFQPRGTPFSVLGRLHALSQMGHDIDLVTYHVGQNVDIDRVRIFRSANLPFIQNIKIGPSLAKVPVDVAVFFKALHLLRNNHYDALHTHEEAGFMGILFKKWFNIPHLYDMHSSLPQQLHNFQFSQSKLLHRLFRFLEDATLRSADGVITICPELYHYVDGLKVARNHELIENVVDYASLFPENGESDSHPIFDDSKVRSLRKILYVGTLEPYQGIDLLIRSAAILCPEFKDIHFLIVGGKPEQVATYQALAAEFNLTDRVSFVGSVSPKVADRFVDFADILVTPRIAGNNTPLKIYSYLRSGKPIIATRHITHTQVLDDSVAELTALTPEAFAQGIRRILTDPQRADSIVQNAKELAERKYSYEVYVKKLQKVIDNLIVN